MNIVNVIAQTPLHLIDAVQHNDTLYIVIKENIPCKTRDGIKAFKQAVKHSFVLCGPSVANARTVLQIKGWKA